jgi:hypothetical protein
MIAAHSFDAIPPDFLIFCHVRVDLYGTIETKIAIGLHHPLAVKIMID